MKAHITIDTNQPKVATSYLLVVFGANLRDQSKGQFEVHAPHCKCCLKLRARGENEFKLLGKSAEDVVRQIWADQIAEGADWFDCYEETYFAPCIPAMKEKVA